MLLDELTSYISGGQTSNWDDFLFDKYPFLRKADRTTKKISRGYQESLLSLIPSICERLRDQLREEGRSADEFQTILNVSLEHVELEILLVEVENIKKGKYHFNDDSLDRFLGSVVQTVWGLGDEIRTCILSRIGLAFDLARNSPAGMMCLVEAVEAYEQAADSFAKNRHRSGIDFRHLRFTNMRAAALEQMCQHFELKAAEVFVFHKQRANASEKGDATLCYFTAVIEAATELVTKITAVKRRMSPCFTPHWLVDALWSSCIAHVCVNQILQQIGGPDGQNLNELTIAQLLDLVAWVEYFRDTIEENFPEVSTMHYSKKAYFEEIERPDFFTGDRRTLSASKVMDSLAWVTNMLWEVHRIAQEEFLVRTRSQYDKFLDKVYGSDAVKNQSSEGKLTTSLCEDIFSFSTVQLRTIRERLSKKSDALILAVCVILSHLRTKQVHSRNVFLGNFENCCAASNDFLRMSETCEDMILDLISQSEFSSDMIATLEASKNELVGVYSSDAVFAACIVHIHVFDPIEEEIGTRLFEREWEIDMVGNDLALSLVQTLEDFRDDLEAYMDEFMLVKSVTSLVSATVIFYVKSLLVRAEKHGNSKRSYFCDNKTAIARMAGDIKIMKAYFQSLIPKMPALKKNIEDDFEILSIIYELLSIAAGLSENKADDFILVLHKRVRDIGITKHIVGDLWHLVAPTEERFVWERVESMEETLVAVAPICNGLTPEVDSFTYVEGLRLDEMAVSFYLKSQRKRPVKETAVENILKNWNVARSKGVDMVKKNEAKCKVRIRKVKGRIRSSF